MTKRKLYNTSLLFFIIGVAVPCCAQESKFVPLFDGKTLKGWRGYQNKEPKTWSVNEKMIVCAGESGVDLVSEKQYSNFELKFEWKISEGGNSGVIYRATEELDKPYKTGPEFQILDDEKFEVGPIEASAGIYGLYGAEEKQLKPVGEFNKSRIVVRGNNIQHWLNETKVIDCHMHSEDWNKKVAASKFMEWTQFGTSKKGHVVLQNHESKVWFRNLEIKELTLDPE